MDIKLQVGDETVFIDREHMTSVYQLDDIKNLAETAYRHFMEHEEEIIYILERDGRILGVLSIGDLERFYIRGTGAIEINSRYTALGSIDYEAAADFFRKHKTINELPVITDNRELLGVIRKKKENYLRNGQRDSLKYSRNGGVRYVKGEIGRFIHMARARVILYTYSNMNIVRHLNAKKRRRFLDRGNRKDVHLWKGLTEEEWKAFWQTEYCEGLVQEFQKERAEQTPILEKGVPYYSDQQGKYFHFKDGYRVTAGNPLGMNRRIIMFGPCIVAGAYCKDQQTIEAYLQNHLIRDDYMEWGVFNCGAYSPEQCYGHLFIQELAEDDIVVILCEEQWMPDKYLDQLVFQGDLTPDFLGIPNLEDYFVDVPSHCNHIVNQHLAERIYMDIRKTQLLDMPKTMGILASLQDYYINWDVRTYFAGYFKQYGLHREPDNVRTGAVVMNCNPFTKGHRYLVEQALGMVDKLYLFVVEEDKSYFRFEDRFHMVKAGVADLENVHVVPSGKYVISKDTFAQYFEKECVQTVESMDYDLYIFGEIVAADLGIQYRFVGKEPFDQVTRAYNEAMKRILPKFGVEVIEFPRILSEESGAMVSATMVRKAIMEKDTDLIKVLCPESTYTFLEKYLL